MRFLKKESVYIRWLKNYSKKESFHMNAILFKLIVRVRVLCLLNLKTKRQKNNTLFPSASRFFIILCVLLRCTTHHSFNFNIYTHI